MFNAACTEDPAIIVVPNNERDVAVALLAAKNAGLPLRFFMNINLSCKLCVQ